MSRRIIAAVILLVLSTDSIVHAQDRGFDAGIDAVFAGWNSDASAGCAVGVSRDGQTIAARAYGMADLEHDIRNTPATIFEAGSVSKQFTAAAALLLVQDGVLGLDDDVRRWVPELPDYGDVIRVRHLINHTSGLRDWGSVAAIGGWGRSDRTHTHDHVLDILTRQRAPNFAPGAEYSYSNSGYNLLAIIIERASGKSFAEFSRQRIFEPLGLRDTQWRDDYTRIVKGRSAAYAMRQSTWVIDRPIEHVHGNGGLLTTVADLLEWTNALAAGRLGGPGFLDLMHERGVLTDGQQIDYASGLVITSFDGVPEISHTGSTSGYRAFLARYPDRGLVVALLCNAGNVNPGVTGRAVARVLLGNGATTVSAAAQGSAAADPLARIRDAIAVSASQLRELTGEYYSPDVEATFTITVDGDRLVLQRRPATRTVLLPTGTDEFGAGSLGRIRFIRDESGRAVQLSVQQARVYDLRFDRVP